MKKDILLALAHMLRTQVSDAEFDMETWWGSCSSVGCAIGHGIQRGLISGLELAKRQPEANLVNAPKLPGADAYGPGTAKQWDFGAVAQALDISFGDADWLFAVDQYRDDSDDDDAVVTRDEVASRIERFVHDH